MRPKTRRPVQIGIFGGTFDPPHIGHLIIAECAREQLGLSKILFVPAANAPHKRGKRSASPMHRLRMLRLAVRGHRGFQVSSVELRRGGVSYTVDTLKSLRKAYSNASFWLIVGSDNLRDFFTWREPENILKISRLAVYRRPRFPVPASVQRRTKAVVLEGGALDVSATLVRNLEGRTRSIRYLVPPAVEIYVRRHRLYRAVPPKK